MDDDNECVILFVGTALAGLLGWAILVGIAVRMGS